MASQSESSQPGSRPQESGQDWLALHQTISDSDDTLRILEVTFVPGQKIHIRDVEFAYHHRIDQLRKLGKGHPEEARSDAQKCLAAKLALEQGKRRLNGNGEAKKEGGNGKQKVAATAQETHQAAAENVPEAVKEPEKQPAATMESGATFISRVGEHKGAVIAGGVAVIAGGAALLMFMPKGQDPQWEKPKTDNPPPVPAVKKISAEEVAQGQPIKNLPPSSPFDPTTIGKPKTAEKPAPIEVKVPLTVAAEKPAPKPEPKPEPKPVVEPAVQTPPKETKPVEVAGVQPKATVKTSQAEKTEISGMDVGLLKGHLAEIRKLDAEAKKTLLEDARNTTDPTLKYATYMVALEEAQAQKAIPVIRSIFAELRRQFNNQDGFILNECEAIIVLAKTPSEALTQWATSTMLEACRGGQHDTAIKLGTLLQRKMPSGKESVGTKRMFGTATKEATRLKKNWETVRPFATILEKTPDDPDANGHMGLYLLELGLIERGVGHLAKANNTLSDLVKKTAQKRNEMDAEQLIQLANEWMAIPGTLNHSGTVYLVQDLLKAASERAKGIQKKTTAEKLRAFQAQHGGLLPVLLAGAQVENNGSADSYSLPLGAINLAGNNFETTLQAGKVVRPKWQVTEDAQRKMLKGTSGFHKWISSMNLPIPSETKKIVQSGHYRCQFDFKRSPDGRWADAIFGTSIFLVPLPNGRSVSINLDNNLNNEFWKDGKGQYRSGFDPSYAPLLGNERKMPTSFMDHQRPLLSEDGILHTLTATVRTVQGAIIIDVRLTRQGMKDPLMNLSITAPPTTESVGEQMFGSVPAQLGPIWGAGVAGGSLIIENASIAPFTQRRGR